MLFERWNQVSVTCIILAVLRLLGYAPLTIAWISTMMFAGYVIRFFWGGKYSFLGATGSIVARAIEPETIAGPPKQFAALCGIMFSGAAAIGYFYGPFYVGPIFHFGLAGAAGMEGFLGFCIGCEMFRLIILPLGKYMGFDLKGMEQACETVLDTRKAQEERFAYHKWNEGPWKTFEGYIPATTADGRPLRWKYSDKTPHQREDRVDFVCYCKLSYALPGLCWAAVAANFKAMYHGGYIPEQWPWAFLTIVGVCFFGLWAALYTLKLCMYPSRVLKDIEGKHSRYYLAAVPIALLLFGYLAQREQDDIARALFWLGAMSNITLTLWLITRTFIHPVSAGEITPGMTIPLLGNMLAGFSLEQWMNWDGIRDLSYFLWGPSFVLWILMAAGILLKITDSPAMGPSLRVTTFSYIAAPALSAQGYLACTNSFDSVFLTLFFFAVTAEFLCAMLFLANYFRAPFNEGYWFAVFCLAALVFPVISFDQVRGTTFTYTWVMIQVSVATGLALIYTAHSLSNIIHGKWFRNFPKPEGVGPLSSLTRLFHDAFRTAGPEIIELCEQLRDNSHWDDQKKAECQKELATLLEQYVAALSIHSSYEDTIFFPTVDMYLPAVRRHAAEEQHKDLHELEDKIMTIIETLKNGGGGAKPQIRQSETTPKDEAKQGEDGTGVQVTGVAVEMSEMKKNSSKVIAPATLSNLCDLLTKFINLNNEHMRHEEDHIGPIAFKLIPSKEQKSIARKCLRVGTPAEWRLALPMIIKHQDYHERRVKFLLSLRKAYPERMQLYGAWLYLGISEILFQRLRVDIPELAPRHTAGHWRQW
uniref:Hemerythrin-like domain-containing protein n=1 Tax=Lotharella oceanica TaxID=641309 RepID=A0A7S2TLB4_9EUKA|mmetsp:Transcript_19509/g.36722  ORF Transcript_19509/g.36722 Transcript_19509/m.36722 type:complete len:816 (+) Transcript_19509:434-2881(+)